ncbi:Endoribonuclease L-PSP/chorismate mutase-like protein [Macrophomina phaseolina]|uniref:Endoribonuclease L-PSP/chorismate mutase-like protein n=1 Tax=Macrophomina phaseolina TaxID=35725 RepID=A0ABQ8GVN1_9PEZI|nr:Endoribonuclease L-PSP/chorismate mutase-like protein [Macrophomina phaseolina]
MKTFLHLVRKLLFSTIILAAAKAREAPLTSNYTSPRGVEIYNPPQSFDPNGPWSMMARAGPTLYVAGMRGFHPSNNSLVSLVSSASSPSDAGYPRISQAFENMAQLARLGGSDITSCTRLVVYVNDMYRWRPAVNRVMEEMWGVANGGIYPVRTIVEVQRLNDDDIVEVEGTFWVG